MKLSAAINFFDGAEFLVPSLQMIRPAVDHVSVVFQDISNFGNPVTRASQIALRQAVSMGLVDEVTAYIPDLEQGGTRNEFAKRAIGIDLAKAADADAVMFMDVDEFYELKPLLRAKNRVVSENLDFTSVYYKNYYRYPTWRMHGAPDGHVPFICRLNDRTRHELSGAYPVSVDPTRAIYVEGGRHLLFSADDILMHHMTGVRLDLEEKIANSSNNDHHRSSSAMRVLYDGIDLLHPGAGVLPSGFIFHIEQTHDRFGLLPLFSPTEEEAALPAGDALPSIGEPPIPDHLGETHTRLCSLPWQKFLVDTQQNPPRAAPCQNFPLVWNAWDFTAMAFSTRVIRGNLLAGSLDAPCRDCPDKIMAPISDLLDMLDEEGLVGSDENRMIEAIQEALVSTAPVPPPHLAQRVAHTQDRQEFLISGLISIFDIVLLLRKYDKSPDCRLLDWGCGSGRIAMHIARRYPDIILTGCDIDAEAVDWCRREIGSGEFRSIDPEPPTPFARQQFTAIIGSSIVTHLTGGLQQRWVDELHDLLAENGIVVLTVHGSAAARIHGLSDRLDSEGIIDERMDPTLDGVAPTGYYRATFQSRAWTERVWGRCFDVIEYIDAGAFGLQDIVVLRKKPAAS